MRNYYKKHLEHFKCKFNLKSGYFSKKSRSQGLHDPLKKFLPIMKNFQTRGYPHMLLVR